MDQAETPGWKSWFVLLGLALIWGSSFILIKKSLIALSSLQVACLRISITAIAFLPVLIIQWSKIPRDKIPYLFIVGLAGSALPAFLFAIAQTKISSALAGLLNSLTPLFALLISVILFRQKVIKEKYFGVILGLIGAAVLILLSAGKGGENNVWYGLLVVVATVCYASSLNVVKQFLQDVNPLLLSAVAYCLVGPFGIVLLAFSGMGESAASPDFWLSMGSVTALALLSTVFASVLFFYLVQATNVVFSASVAYIIPIVALGFAFWDGEQISGFHLIGMLLILVGVYLSRERKKRKPAVEV